MPHPRHLHAGFILVFIAAVVIAIVVIAETLLGQSETAAPTGHPGAALSQSSTPARTQPVPKWESIPPSPLGGSHHTFGFALGESGYLLSGTKSTGEKTDAFFRFELATRTWHNLAGSAQASSHRVGIYTSRPTSPCRLTGKGRAIRAEPWFLCAALSGRCTQLRHRRCVRRRSVCDFNGHHPSRFKMCCGRWGVRPGVRPYGASLAGILGSARPRRAVCWLICGSSTASCGHAWTRMPTAPIPPHRRARCATSVLERARADFCSSRGRSLASNVDAGAHAVQHAVQRIIQQASGDAATCPSARMHPALVALNGKLFLSCGAGFTAQGEFTNLRDAWSSAPRVATAPMTDPG